MKKHIIFFLIILMTSLLTAGHIDDNRLRWKEYYKNYEPAQKVTAWYIPFAASNRKDIKAIKVVSTFGAYRSSFVKGHKHTGLDINPKKNTGAHVFVYPIATGVVVSVHLGHPHKTVVVKHKLRDGSVIYSSYKHLHEYYVKLGQQLHKSSKIGRLYTREEALSHGGNYDHLHLEIRKKFDDYGCASWATMTKAELKKRFYDPLKFLKERL